MRLVVPVVPLMAHFMKIAMADLVEAGVAMLEGFRLDGGYGQAQRGNQCKCKQFFR
ncbi:MAG: hypothetical protein JWN94_185 [Betaproteobacteria bacterium]|nr:hypothetical protein [Betaproteobacteria bacterium]